MKERILQIMKIGIQGIRTRWKSVIGYTLFVIAALFVFLYLTFPWKLVEARVLYELSRNTGYAFKAGESRFTFPAGIRFEEVRVLNPHPDPRTDARALGRIDQAALQVSLKDLLWGKVTSTFDIEAFGGSMIGTVGQTAQRTVLDTAWKKVELARIRDIGQTPVIFSGISTGMGHLIMKPNGADGSLRVTIDQGKIKGLKLMGFPLPDLAFDQVRGAAEIRGKTLTLKEVKLQGEDVKGSIKGDIVMGDPSTPATLDLQLRIHLSDRAKAPYQGLLSLVAKNRDKEGYYRFSLKGPAKEPKVGLES
jgi:type II secretion system protein N